MASIGFFFGIAVSPWYFYGTVGGLFCLAGFVSWRRALAYAGMVLACAALTAYTFSYVGGDAQSYHFPMQYLLKHGWNPVFDSTVEKFSSLVGEAPPSIYHTLFLPKYNALCGAIVASAFGLFTGDGFLGYVLIICLFARSFKFARNFWGASLRWSIVFAASIAFSTKITAFLVGYGDYTRYAALAIAMLSLILHVKENKLDDLVVFFLSASICMASKSTGLICVCAFMALMLPYWVRRRAVWQTLLLVAISVMIVGASSYLTNWIQYGSPFYPVMTFNPNIQVVDITNDFTGNPDAVSMGYVARMCYAWVSPQLTVALIRLFTNNAAFNPVFEVYGGVAGLGLWFNCLLLLSVVLLAVSKKNVITWFCVVIFIISNLSPLKYIGYSRYFPQIWLIFPLAVLNFVYSTRIDRRWTYALAAVLIGWSALSLARTLAFQCRLLAQENLRQQLIAGFKPSKCVTVDKGSFSFTNVMRFRNAGIELRQASDGKIDTTINPVSVLPCNDTHPEQTDEFDAKFPLCNGITSLISFPWMQIPGNLPRILWNK